MIWATLADGRHTLRRQLGHPAVIMAEPGAPSHYCLVIDTSDRGVRVSTSHDFEVPDRFILRLSSEQARALSLSGARRQSQKLRSN
jgi:hypothetical protein